MSMAACTPAPLAGRAELDHPPSPTRTHQKASFGPALSIGVGMGITVGAMREAALYTTGDIVSPTYYFLSSLAGTTGWVAFGLRLAPKDAMLTSAVLSALSTVVTLMVESKAEAQKVRAFENHYEIGGKEGTVRGQDQKLYDLWLRARDEQGRLSVEGKGGGLFWGAPPSIDDFRNPAGQVDYTAFYRELEKHYIRPFQWDVVETYKNSTTPSDFNPNKYLKTMDSTVDKYRKRDD
eukprot:TRINITY_DN15484_c0_g1_i2.p1 TRINITY_DN15484_c0_g1~~TRINITY_DN15484_c0_g1_i2.p1  ORF type:complete len:236 (+),score=68.11 TRINITY_DN15484_c0_g1_i2:1-708(+)